MLKFVMHIALVGVAISVCSVSASADDPHEGDLWLAVSAAGQLKLSPLGFHPDEHVVVLEAGGPWYPGWSDTHPGFDQVAGDDPEHDCYVIGPGAVIELEVVDLDPALVVWYGFTRIEPGQRQELGSTPGEIHMHLNWNINSDEPDFDALRAHWRATLRLVDTGSAGYADSEDFTLIFSNVACLLGDVNGDAVLNAFDIDPFVVTLADPEAASAEARCASDANLDGVLNAFDIDAFVRLLAG